MSTVKVATRYGDKEEDGEGEGRLGENI